MKTPPISTPEAPPDDQRRSTARSGGAARAPSRPLFLPLCLLLVACAGKAPDSGDSPIDTEDSAQDSDSGVLPADVYTFVGAPSDAAGNAVTLPGDLDGDTVPDVVIAGYYGNRVCMFSGATLLTGDARRTMDDAELCWSGASTYDFSGYSLAPAGDGDGDGRQDLLVGAIGDGTNGSNAGRVWLLSGASGSGEVQLSQAASGSAIGELGSDYAGVAACGGRDLTGDGVLDYLVGASGSDAAGAGGGSAYLVEGPLVGEVQLAEARSVFLGLPVDATALLHGEFGGGDAIGNAVAMLGDYDGDGLDDLALGASGADENGTATGKVVVYWGPIAAGDHEITDADLTLVGPDEYAYTGSPIHAPGDVDGDGFADLLVSADGYENGTIFLVHGALGSGSNEVRALDDEPTRWFGEVSDDQAGFALASGDMNGDSVLDLAAGAPGSDRPGQDAGAAYVIYGPWSAGSHALADAGEILLAEQVADAFAHALASGSDIDGDGIDELLVGAIYNDDGGAFSGKGYLY